MTFDEKSGIPIFNNDYVSVKDLPLYLHKAKTFWNKLKQVVLNDDVLNSKLPPYIDENQGALFHYGYKNEKRKSHYYYIHKDHIPYFFTRYKNEIKALGVDTEDILAATGELKTYQESDYKKEERVKLWTLAAKCAHSPKVAVKLSKYIKENLLTATYTEIDPLTHEESRQNFFGYIEHFMGKSGAFLKKKVEQLFLSKYREHLLQISCEMEKESDFISLRDFSRFLSNTALEGKLLNFIKNHLDETYIETDENGIIHTNPIFQYQQRSKIHHMVKIAKKGIEPFVLKYQDELIHLGFTYVNALKHNFNRKQSTGFISLTALARKLYLPIKSTNSFIKTMVEKFIHDEITDEMGNKRKLFYAAYHSNMTYYIKETDLTHFVQKYQNELLSLGMKKEALSLYLDQEDSAFKTDEMIRLKTFANMLGKSLNSSFYKKMRQHMHDRCLILDENKNPVETNVFTTGKFSNGFFQCFKNKETLKAFIINNHKMFLDMKIAPKTLEQITGKEFALPYSEDYIFLSNIAKFIHKKNTGIGTEILKHHKNDTYIETTPTGHENIKPLCVLMQHQSDEKRPSYAIHKNGLLKLIQMYPEKFNVKPIFMEAMLQNEKIIKQTDNMITLYQLTNLFGKSGTFGATFTRNLKSLFLKDEVSIKASKGEQCHPVFCYAYSISGTITTCIYTNAIVPFLKKRHTELLKLGLTSAQIQRAISSLEKQPDLPQQIIKIRKQKMKNYLSKQKEEKQHQ